MRTLTLTLATLLSLALGAPISRAEATPAPTNPWARCSIHPPHGTRAADLPALAKVTKSDAETLALKAFAATQITTIAESELEVEHGCLIWSFDVRVAGRKGIDEVNVDAGNGTILAQEHEGRTGSTTAPTSAAPKH